MIPNEKRNPHLNVASMETNLPDGLAFALTRVEVEDPGDHLDCHWPLATSEQTAAR